MNKNLRKTLLCLLPALFCSCAKNTAKTVTIDEGLALVNAALENDTAASFSLASYSFKSTISAPSELQADLPYLSLSVSYQVTAATQTYLTTIHRVTSSSDDTYAISKDVTSGQAVYWVKANGGSPLAYDPIKDGYIGNYFELPNFFYIQNNTGLSTSRDLLKNVVSDQPANKLTSYNLSSKGSGNLDMTLRGSTLDFSSFFSEVPVINTNIASIHFSIDANLIQSLEASYLVLPAQAPSASSPSVSFQKSPTSSVGGTPCTITMVFGYATDVTHS